MARLGNAHRVRNNNRRRHERERHERERHERERRERSEKGRQSEQQWLDEHHANPGETYNPGVENKPVEPFLTQQDLEEYAEAREQYEEGLKTLDRNYESKQHSNEYETAQIEVGRKQSKSSANWDFAGRGLFKSSIRSTNLADIDATAEIKKKFLSDSLSALQIYNDGQKKAAGNRWHRYEEALNRKKVENAEGVDSTMPKWRVEPHWETKTNTIKPTQTKPKEPVRREGLVNPSISRKHSGGTEAPSSTGPKHEVGNNKRISPKHAVNIGSNQIAGKLYG